MYARRRDEEGRCDCEMCMLGGEGRCDCEMCMLGGEREDVIVRWVS